MTNEQKAIELIGCEGRSNCIKCGGRLSVEKGCSEFQNIMAMATCKDEQFAKEKQALVDKACEAYRNELLQFQGIIRRLRKSAKNLINIEGSVADFRKAMEETK